MTFSTFCLLSSQLFLLNGEPGHATIFQWSLRKHVYMVFHKTMCQSVGGKQVEQLNLFLKHKTDQTGAKKVTKFTVLQAHGFSLKDLESKIPLTTVRKQ